MKTIRGVLGLLVVAMLMVSVVGCNAMPVTMSPFGSYGGSGYDYRSPGDPNHQWQVGIAASFVLGGNGAVANAIPTPSLPTRVSVNNSSSNNASNSNSNSNSNTNSNTNTTNVDGGTTNNGFVPPGHQ